MAVTAPYAPTPPTPPAVPKVTLEGGGMVPRPSLSPPRKNTQTETPAIGGEASEATGTEQSLPEPGTTQTVTTSPQQPQKTEKAADPQGKSTESAESQAADVPIIHQGAELPGALMTGTEEGKETAAQTTVPYGNPQPATSSHSIAYWVFSLSALLILAVVVVQTLRKRNVIQKAVHPERLQTSGKTAETILRNREEEKRTEIVAAKVAAAARKYQSQLEDLQKTESKTNTAEKRKRAAERKPLTQPASQKKPRGTQEDSPHFEVRV